MKAIQPFSTASREYNNIEPNQLKHDHIGEMLEEFQSFVNKFVSPLFDNLSACLTNSVKLTDHYDIVQSHTKAAKQMFKSFTETGVMNTSLMYYTGESPERADNAECIEIVDLEICEYETDVGSEFYVKPVWSITPNEHEKVKVSGTYVGESEGVKYYIASQGNGYIITSVKETIDDIQVNSNFITSEPDNLVFPVVKRACAMGLISFV